MSVYDATTAICEALDTVNWPVGLSAPWGVDGVQVDKHTYVNSIDTHIDGDYRHWFLVEVCVNEDQPGWTHMGPHQERRWTDRGETWVSWLAVFWESGEVIRTAWFPAEPQPFFDRETIPIRNVRGWFINWQEV